MQRTIEQPKLETAIAAVIRSNKFREWRPANDSVPVPENFIRVPNFEAAMEPHYSPAELAEKWGVSIETIRVIFREEPGVLKIGKPGNKYKRQYFTLRIPETIAERVHQRLSA